MIYFLITLIIFLIPFKLSDSQQIISDTVSQVLSSPTPQPVGILPDSKTLKNSYHVYQTFNNCGPAALSMALSYYDIKKSQKELGDILRPYQIADGNNDDKSVTLAEMANQAKNYNLIPYHRPNGNINLIKEFINLNIPVITRTWTKPNEDIGHYRVVKGYDERSNTIIQDDSLQGKNLKYSYEEFNILWQKFNFEYLVLVPSEKESQVKLILGEDADEMRAWEKAADTAENFLSTHPDDANMRLNYSVALYRTGKLNESVAEFEKAEPQLPKRSLWYQIEPIQAYFELDNFNRVFELTENILYNGNRAFSELYIIRGKIFQKEGNITLAKEEFEKAVLYNNNLIEAQYELDNVSDIH
jgi:predicted double-glycine peptidase